MKFNLTPLETVIFFLICLFIFIWTNYGRKIRSWLQDYFRQRRGSRNLKPKSPEDGPVTFKNLDRNQLIERNRQLMTLLISLLQS